MLLVTMETGYIKKKLLQLLESLGDSVVLSRAMVKTNKLV